MAILQPLQPMPSMEALKISQNMNGNSCVRNPGGKVWHFFPLFSIAFLFFKSLWMAAPSPNQVAPAIHAMPGKPTNANEGPHQAVLIVL